MRYAISYDATFTVFVDAETEQEARDTSDQVAEGVDELALSQDMSREFGLDIEVSIGKAVSLKNIDTDEEGIL